MSDAYKRPDVQTISEVISDALMRAGTMKACLVIYIDKEDQVCCNFSASRVERLGMLEHVRMHEQACEVRDIDDYVSEDGSDDE